MTDPTHNCHDVPHDFLDKLDHRLRDLQQGLAEIRTLYEAHHKRLDRIENTLYGNGQAGLSTKVTAILWIASGSLTFVALIAAQTIANLIKG